MLFISPLPEILSSNLTHFFDSLKLKPPTRTQMCRMYRLFTYMKGETWPHEEREWVGKYSHPMENLVYFLVFWSHFLLGFPVIYIYIYHF